MRGKKLTLLLAGIALLISVAIAYARSHAIRTGVETAATPSRTTSETGDALVSSDLTVHEWGTFTSVAGKSGSAVEWLPLSNDSLQTDLPCFVDGYALWPKALMFVTVRMETPVLYFYADRETKVRATVRFPKGLITEWYPHASLTNKEYWGEDDKSSILDWSNVTVLPHSTPTLPLENDPSHYYAARQTDAAPVRVGTQNEKFLFYRGVGDFQPPIRTMIEDGGRILVQNTDRNPIPQVILFENRGGRIGYRVKGPLSGEAVLDAPALDGDFSSLQKELEKTLVAVGLFPKEAAAMVATWRDSWFEEGMRVFYIVPPKTVDEILPLAIEPRPGHISRAFVGRMEVLSPATEHAVVTAIKTGDKTTLKAYARFLRPIAGALLEKKSNPEIQQQLEEYTNFSDELAEKISAQSTRCRSTRKPD